MAGLLGDDDNALLAATVGTACTLISTYLNARAAGRELRNANLALFISNLVLGFPLIIAFGAMGAAVASLISMLVILSIYVIYVRRLEGPGSGEQVRSAG